MDNKRRKLSYRTFHYHRTSLNQIQNINTRLPGTAFEDLPDDWVCPLCGVGKDEFEKAS